VADWITLRCGRARLSQRAVLDVRPRVRPAEDSEPYQDEALTKGGARGFHLRMHALRPRASALFSLAALWILLTPATNRVASAPAKSVGLSILPDERGLKVFAVIPNTDAARAGIRRGDYIITINNQPAKEWHRKRLRALRDQAEPIEVEIVSCAKHRRLKFNVTTLIE